jgi:thiazole synthase
MAVAFKLAVEAGRIAYNSCPGAARKRASASSPLTGFLRDEREKLPGSTERSV